MRNVGGSNWCSGRKFFHVEGYACIAGISNTEGNSDVVRHVQLELQSRRDAFITAGSVFCWIADQFQQQCLWRTTSILASDAE